MLYEHDSGYQPDYHLLFTLYPLRTFVVRILQNTALFRTAVPTRRTGAASLPAIRIAIHTAVVNVEFGLSNVVVKLVPKGAAVVANELIVRTRWETIFITGSVGVR